jgi:hypothetical protein
MSSQNEVTNLAKKASNLEIHGGAMCSNAMELGLLQCALEVVLKFSLST